MSPALDLQLHTADLRPPTGQEAFLGITPSDPPVLVPRQVGKIFLTGLAVDQADDEVPHDRLPLLTKREARPPLFPDCFADRAKWFHGGHMRQYPQAGSRPFDCCIMGMEKRVAAALAAHMLPVLTSHCPIA